MLDEGRTLALRGKAERDAGRSEAAIALYGEAAEVARREGDVLALAHRLRHIGDIHRDAGRIDRAAPFCAEALALYRSRDDVKPLDLANLLRPMALLSEAVEESEAARQYWLEARALYEQAGVTAGVEECARHLLRR